MKDILMVIGGLVVLIVAGYIAWSLFAFILVTVQQLRSRRHGEGAYRGHGSPTHGGWDRGGWDRDPNATDAGWSDPGSSDYGNGGGGEG